MTVVVRGAVKHCRWKFALSQQTRLDMGYVSVVDSQRRTIWIVDAHRDGKRFIVRADEKLTAFVELERAIYEFAAFLSGRCP
jgi:hypothetical protein